MGLREQAALPKVDPNAGIAERLKKLAERGKR
jgi:hypothetical protein